MPFHRPSYRRDECARIRAEINEMLGGVCDLCGAEENLEVDHPYGRDWQPRKVNRLDRLRRYLREARKGLIRLLCRSCNATDGCKRQHKPKPADPENAPF